MGNLRGNIKFINDIIIKLFLNHFDFLNILFISLVKRLIFILNFYYIHNIIYFSTKFF